MKSNTVTKARRRSPGSFFPMRNCAATGRRWVLIPQRVRSRRGLTTHWIYNPIARFPDGAKFSTMMALKRRTRIEARWSASRMCSARHFGVAGAALCVYGTGILKSSKILCQNVTGANQR